MATPVVSILIPAYNSEAWIADTLRSALAQTWPATEIIVVDDGSTDGTLEIASQFSSDGVCVLTQKNQGAAAARNAAFAASRGDYIQWLDADDLLSPDKIERQMVIAQQVGNTRVLFSSAWGQFLCHPERAEFKPTALWCDLSPAEWLLRKMGQNLHMQTATWLVSREVTESAGPWDTRLLGDDDGEYFCRVLLESDGVRFVPEAKVYYRDSGTSSLSYIGRSERKVSAQWRSMELHIGYLRTLEDSARSREACVKYIRNWLIYFYPDRADIVCQAERMASGFGYQLGEPRLTWKYTIIKRVFGWRVTKLAQLRLSELRSLLLRYREQLLVAAEAVVRRLWGRRTPRSRLRVSNVAD